MTFLFAGKVGNTKYKYKYIEITYIIPLLPHSLFINFKLCSQLFQTFRNMHRFQSCQIVLGRSARVHHDPVIPQM